MTAPDHEIERLPSPPRLPRPMPGAGKEGWWISIGGDPRVVRYHDGTDWTEFIIQVRLRGPGPVERDPLPPQEDPSLSDDPDVRRLPRPPRSPEGYLEDNPPATGWFRSPYGDEEKQLARYREDHETTEFAVELLRGGVGPIQRRPRKR